jgi:hypothetical protein
MAKNNKAPLKKTKVGKSALKSPEIMGYYVKWARWCG